MMNKAFDKATRTAKSTVNSPRKKKKLADAASRIASSGKHSLKVFGITGKIKPLVRMVRCSVSREYLDTPWQTIVIITAALIYFVSPFDAIPDFLPFIGFVDDAAIISAVFASISKDVEKFIAWEAGKSASESARISSAEPE